MVSLFAISKWYFIIYNVNYFCTRVSLNISVVCFSGPLLLILEYASLGCLKTFLRKAQRNFFRMENMSTQYYNSVIKKVDLLSFALQIAKGMEYLASKKVLFTNLPLMLIFYCKIKVETTLFIVHAQLGFDP